MAAPEQFQALQRTVQAQGELLAQLPAMQQSDTEQLQAGVARDSQLEAADDGHARVGQFRVAVEHAKLHLILETRRDRLKARQDGRRLVVAQHAPRLARLEDLLQLLRVLRDNQRHRVGRRLIREQCDRR